MGSCCSTCCRGKQRSAKTNAQFSTGDDTEEEGGREQMNGNANGKVELSINGQTCDSGHSNRSVSQLCGDSHTSAGDSPTSAGDSPQHSESQLEIHITDVDSIGHMSATSQGSNPELSTIVEEKGYSASMANVSLANISISSQQQCDVHGSVTVMKKVHPPSPRTSRHFDDDVDVLAVGKQNLTASNVPAVPSQSKLTTPSITSGSSLDGDLLSTKLQQHLADIPSIPSTYGTDNNGFESEGISEGNSGVEEHRPLGTDNLALDAVEVYSTDLLQNILRQVDNCGIIMEAVADNLREATNGEAEEDMIAKKHAEDAEGVDNVHEVHKEDSDKDVDRKLENVDEYGAEDDDGRDLEADDRDRMIDAYGELEDDDDDLLQQMDVHEVHKEDGDKDVDRKLENVGEDGVEDGGEDDAGRDLEVVVRNLKDVYGDLNDADDEDVGRILLQQIDQVEHELGDIKCKLVEGQELLINSLQESSNAVEDEASETDVIVYDDINSPAITETTPSIIEVYSGDLSSAILKQIELPQAKNDYGDFQSLDVEDEHNNDTHLVEDSRSCSGNFSQPVTLHEVNLATSASSDSSHESNVAASSPTNFLSGEAILNETVATTLKVEVYSGDLSTAILKQIEFPQAKNDSYSDFRSPDVEGGHNNETHLVEDSRSYSGSFPQPVSLHKLDLATSASSEISHESNVAVSSPTNFLSGEPIMNEAVEVELYSSDMSSAILKQIELPQAENDSYGDFRSHDVEGGHNNETHLAEDSKSNSGNFPQPVSLHKFDLATSASSEISHESNVAVSSPTNFLSGEAILNETVEVELYSSDMSSAILKQIEFPQAKNDSYYDFRSFDVEDGHNNETQRKNVAAPSPTNFLSGEPILNEAVATTWEVEVCGSPSVHDVRPRRFSFSSSVKIDDVNDEKHRRESQDGRRTSGEEFANRRTSFSTSIEVEIMSGDSGDVAGEDGNDVGSGGIGFVAVERAIEFEDEVPGPVNVRQFINKFDATE